jgi:hypothetical protein
MTAPTTVSTLVASARISRGDGSAARARPGASGFDNLSIGQNLKLQVLRQIDQHRYQVAFGGARHVVESRVQLNVGAQIEAQVESIGERLELRYLNGGPRFDAPEALPASAEAEQSQVGDAKLPPWLVALAAQHRVPLDAAAGETIARAASAVRDPELLSRGGLFLQKLAQRVTPQDLEALYRVLHADERAAMPAATLAPIPFDASPDDVDAPDMLADALDAAVADALDPAVTDVGGDANADAGADDGAQRALRLLNLQDEGSVAWRYATLPLLVAGQLIELDVVMFAEREKPATRGALRRLVMSLETAHFGRVQVEARAVDSRIIVRIGAGTADAVETLSAYGQDVRAAIERLGWSVDEIHYEIDARPEGAAHQVINHVLSAGSVDREL